MRQADARSGRERVEGLLSCPALALLLSDALALPERLRGGSERLSGGSDKCGAERGRLVRAGSWTLV